VAEGGNTQFTEFYWSLYDFVAIELGAMNPFAAPTYVPPPPGLSVGINGPTWIEDEGQYSWQAVPANGSGGYSCAWEFSEDAITWYGVGSSQTYQTYVSELDEPYFWLRATVIDGTGDSAANAKKITVAIGGCSGNLC
jgi:hypothetical protein